MVPVPDSASPVSSYRHPKLGKPATLWEYRNSDGLVGYIARWDLESAGGDRKKEIRPLTFCQVEGSSAAWSTAGFPTPWPLYRLLDLLARSTAPVLVVEGEKAADAGAALFPDFVVTTAPHGARSPQNADWSPLHGRDVVISPDADEAGGAYADAVRRLALEAGAAGIRILRPETLASREVREGALHDHSRPIPKGWDLADAADSGWTAELVRELAATNEIFEPYDPGSGPPGGGGAPPAPMIPCRGFPRGRAKFECRSDGVYYRPGDQQPEEAIWVCSPLEVLARTRNTNSEEHGRLLRLTDPDGKLHVWAMPNRLLSGDGTAIREHLLSLGLTIAPTSTARQALNKYLMTTLPEATARCVGQMGWQRVDGRPVFLLPDGTVFGDCGAERLVYQTPLLRPHSFDVSGAPEKWENDIGKLCVGNSRMVLAISTALAGPLLYLMGAESGGVHIYGPSSCGKTTLLAAAGSVWGGGGIRGFVQSWRATDNGLEGDAAAHCDTMLCLDELSECDPRAAANAAYMLANGRGKSRADRSGDGRPKVEWRLLFLSTGEVTLSERLAEDRLAPKARAGQDVRLLNVPADAEARLGVFETLHGAASPAALADAIREACSRSYGHLGRAFVEVLAREPAVAREAVSAIRKAFLQAHCPPRADGQVQRAAGRFALIAAAGEFAASRGILAWPQGEAVRGVAACFRSWLEARGTSGSAEDATAAAQVRRFFENFGESRFETSPSDSSGRAITNRAGYRRRVGERIEWLVFPGVWKEEVCKGLDSARVSRLGVEEGWITPDSQGKPTSTHRTLGSKPQRFYVVTDAIFHDGSANV